MSSPVVSGRQSWWESLELRTLFSGATLPLPPDINHSVVAFPSSTADPRAVAAVGNVAVFGGGDGVAYLYHTDTGKWSTTPFPQKKFVPDAATAIGNLVMFAGSSTGAPAPGTGSDDTVDLYDVVTGHWSSHALSQKRSQPMTAVSGGQFALFAGGESAAVDIYNASTGKWSTATLSQARYGISGVSVGHQILLAGGFVFGSPTPIQNSSAVDVFDTFSGKWSTATISQRGSIAATAVGGKAIFAGGDAYVPTSNGVVDGTHNVVYLPERQFDVYDSTTGVWSKPALPDSPSAMSRDATALGRYALTDGGEYQEGVFAWDTMTGQWFQLPSSGGTDMSATAGSEALFAGGSAKVDVFSLASPAQPPPALTATLGRLHKGHVPVTLTSHGTAVAAGSVGIDIYASTTGSLDAKAVRIGSMTLTKGLAAGQSAPLSIAITLPRGMAAGNYHLIAVARRKSRLAVLDSSRVTFAVV